MSYRYEDHRAALFTEQGQVDFIKMRDKVKHLLKTAGAFRMDTVMGTCGGTWDDMAALDRMIELKELVKWSRGGWAQYDVYTSPEIHNI